MQQNLWYAKRPCGTHPHPPNQQQRSQATHLTAHDRRCFERLGIKQSTTDFSQHCSQRAQTASAILEGIEAPLDTRRRPQAMMADSNNESPVISLMRHGSKLTKTAQLLWAQVVKPGDTVVDATCGNGHDTLALAQLVGNQGSVYAFDVQQVAVDNTLNRLHTELQPEDRPKMTVVRRSHAEMQEVVGSFRASCIVFNLGYLPKGDKSIVTQASSTIPAVEAALEVVKPGGLISMMLYHGHGEEGSKEAEAVRQLARELSPTYWVCTEMQLLNRPSAPYMLNIWRRDD